MKRKLKIKNLIILIVCAVGLCLGIFFITNKNTPAEDPSAAPSAEPHNSVNREEEIPESDVDIVEEDVIEIEEGEEQGGF
ncbi:MAG: hypothetical protein IKQ27_04390 [Lachnospiraceae bacterium]|nr:hypothetical protein [Lachnospiraceae bacterium]